MAKYFVTCDGVLPVFPTSSGYKLVTCANPVVHEYSPNLSDLPPSDVAYLSGQCVSIMVLAFLINRVLKMFDFAPSRHS